MIGKILSHLRALYQLHQFAHWKSSGPTYYGDHLLFERLAAETEKLMDGISEKSVGLFGEDEIDVVEDADLTKQLISKWQSKDSFSHSAFVAVKTTVEFIEATIKELEKTGKTTDGLQNLLQGIADKLESHLYLLGQRNKQAVLVAGLTKIANELDRKGLYEEADEIDQILREAAMSHYNTFVRALKEDDLATAKKIMSHLSPAELQLTDADFMDLAKFIWENDLAGARGLMGIIKGNPDADLGRPTVSPHLKDFFIPDKDVLTVKEVLKLH